MALCAVKSHCYKTKALRPRATSLRTKEDIILVQGVLSTHRRDWDHWHGLEARLLREGTMAGPSVIPGLNN